MVTEDSGGVDSLGVVEIHDYPAPQKYTVLAVRPETISYTYFSVVGHPPKRGGGYAAHTTYLGTLKFRGDYVESKMHAQDKIVGGKLVVGDVWTGGKKSDIGQNTRLILESVIAAISRGPVLEKCYAYATKVHRATIARYRRMR